MKLVFENKRRMKESYIRETDRWQLGALLDALDKMGYSGCFHEHNGKIIADDVTLKQIQNALIDEYGWDYDIIYKDEYEDDFDESLSKKRMDEGFESRHDASNKLFDICNELYEVLEDYQSELVEANVYNKIREATDNIFDSTELFSPGRLF